MGTTPIMIARLLLQNADHFLTSTCTALANSEPNSNKENRNQISFDELFTSDRESTIPDHRNALVFVAAGVELLLKARLASVHWSQVFLDPGKAHLAALESHNFVSLGASELCDRVMRLTGREIDKDTAAKIFSTRNATIHFSPPPNNAIYVRVLVGLNFSLDFLAQELEPFLSDDDKNLASNLRQKITTSAQLIDDLKDQRLKLLEGLLKTKALTLHCPSCLQQALVLDGDSGDFKCHFCLRKGNSSDLADEYVEAFLKSPFFDQHDGASAPLIECPDCGNETLVIGVKVQRRDKLNSLCFNCCEDYSDYEFQECTRCGTTFLPDADDTTIICADCWSNLDWS